MRSVFSLFKYFNKSTNINEIITSTHDLYIACSAIHGRGVFAKRPFKKGAIIEVCPIMEIPLSYLHQNSALILNYYAFMLDKDSDRSMLLLGYGSIYNHAAPSNATCFFEEEKRVMSISAVRNIARHEEITINYHGPFDSDDPIDFWKQH
jgi:SET domain-containing protein